MADIEVHKDHYLETDYKGLEDILLESPLPTSLFVRLCNNPNFLLKNILFYLII